MYLLVTHKEAISKSIAQAQATFGVILFRITAGHGIRNLSVTKH